MQCDRGNLGVSWICSKWYAELVEFGSGEKFVLRKAFDIQGLVSEMEPWYLEGSNPPFSIKKMVSHPFGLLPPKW